MDQPFEIKFDYPLTSSDIIISVKATATLHHSDPYYVVDYFHLASNKPPNGQPSIMAPQEIKLIRRGAENVWVHKDSERETLLSMAMGKAIEQHLSKQ